MRKGSKSLSKQHVFVVFIQSDPVDPSDRPSIVPLTVQNLDLGVLPLHAGLIEEAVARIRIAKSARAATCRDLQQLSNALCAAGDLDEASAYAARSLYLQTENAEAQNAPGNSRKDQGRLDDALTCYRRGSEA